MRQACGKEVERDMDKRTDEEIGKDIEDKLQRLKKIGELGAMQSLTGNPMSILNSTLAISAMVQSMYFELILRRLEALKR
jgi:hypothetical protein